VFSGFRTKLFKEPKIVFSNHLMMLAASQSVTRLSEKSPVLHRLIEATALHWDSTIVTRNTFDFVQARTLNPWLSA
jgi:hypothetical protein